MNRLFDTICDRVFYDGYLAASARSIRDVVARFSRGSVALQLGRYLTRADAERLHIDAERAAARLEKRVGKATRR